MNELFRAVPFKIVGGGPRKKSNIGGEGPKKNQLPLYKRGALGAGLESPEREGIEK